MTDTTAKIRAKGLDATGVTEDIANQMYAVKGRHYMAIVEMKVEELHEKADGTRKVDLILTQVEPATTDDLAEHLRELTRTLYYNRGDGHQPTLTGNDEPTVEGVLAAGGKYRPHPFLPVNTDEDTETPICDVCGLIAVAGVHSTQETLDDPEPDDEDDRGPYEDEGEYEGVWVEDEPLAGTGDAVNADTGEVTTYPNPLPAIDQEDGEQLEQRHLSTVPDPFAAPA